jgi:hypothetical protein
LQGLSYSAWQERWVQWALSANPVYGHLPREPVFAHGSLNYTYIPGTEIREPYELVNISANIEGQQDRSVEIYNDTPIIVNAMGAFYFIGDVYDGRILEDSSACIDACKQDMRATRALGCEIQKVGENWQRCPLHYVESRFFNVDVSEHNPYLGTLETPLQPGPHQGFTVNHCLIITKLDDGEYFLRFGAKGRKGYESRGFYQLIVNGESITDPEIGFSMPPLRINDKDIKLISGINSRQIKLT